MSDTATCVDCGTNTPLAFVMDTPDGPLCEPCDAARGESRRAPGWLGIAVPLMAAAFLVVGGLGCSMRSTSEFGVSMYGINTVTTTYGPDVPSFVMAAFAVGLSAVTMHRARRSQGATVGRVLAAGLALITLVVGLLQVWDARPHKVTVDLDTRSETRQR